jgi:hypothetical protein
MAMSLKSLFLAAAVLATTAARAGAASSDRSGPSDGAYSEAPGDQTTQRGAAGRYSSAGEREATARPQQTTTPRDERATAGGGSGEPARAAAADWNRREFQREVWEQP